MGSSNIESMADGLVEETLVEAATTFFGARRALEREMELYQGKAEALAEVEGNVLARAAALHFLLLEGRAAADFYAAIGAEPGHLLDAVDVAHKDMSGIKPPFALFRSGRYAKLVLRVYEALATAMDLYEHGTHIKDESGRQRLTVNHSHLEGWCVDLNRKIEALNRNHSPSGTMCFIKGLDPGQLEKDSITEATLNGYGQELDRELAFKPVECITMNYLTPSDLPDPKAVKSAVFGFCRGLYARSGQEIRELMARWDPR